MYFAKGVKPSFTKYTLGFGCMRFPKKAGLIDMAETEREILTAIEGGVNYFDTAYVYPGSEAALGEILEHQAGDSSRQGGGNPL